MCIQAGQYDPANPEMPLYKCDFFNSEEAGQAMMAMLELGQAWV